jgi:C-terminal processing protease CtpA/Prc
MKQWLIILTAGIFLIPAFCNATDEPPQSKKQDKKIVTVTKAKGGWLGVSISDVDEEAAKEKKLGVTEGAYVDNVTDESPADSAGIQKGDVIVEFDGKKIVDAAGLRESVGNSSPGKKVPVVLMRSGEKKILPVVLGKPKEITRHMRMNPAVKPRQFKYMMHGPELGMNIETLNEQLGEYFGAPNGEGVLVREVYKKSAAEKAGFKAGDVIVRVGKKSVDEANDIRKALRKAEAGTSLDFEVLRKGVIKTITVPIEKKEDEDCQSYHFEMPECPSGEFLWKDFDIPDIDIQIDTDELPKLQEEMNRLRDELGKMKIEKRIKVLVSPHDI